MLGWQPFFQQQLTLDEWEQASPARIIEYHRSEMLAVAETGEFKIHLLSSMPAMVVGDWVLVDEEQRFIRLLERKTCFSRKAAGSEVKTQLISANVDSAFIVSSMNEDFNLNRIERFLALVNESGAEPVVILSKSDLSDTPEDYVDQIRKVDPTLIVEPVNCLTAESVAGLSPWLKSGRTIAVLGSSGVGKSTLVNTLLGEHAQSTGGIRDDDSKGRHTTTSRSLIKLASGALILDTPGMREIQPMPKKALPTPLPTSSLSLKSVDSVIVPTQLNRVVRCKKQLKKGNSIAGVLRTIRNCYWRRPTTLHQWRRKERKQRRWVNFINPH